MNSADLQKSKRDKGRQAKRKRYGVFEDGPVGVAPSWRYFALFRLLQISESYWLAHHEQVCGLNPQTVPLEFDKVRHTYGLFGSVWDIPFWVWWRERARTHFGAEERVELLGHRHSGQPAQTGELSARPDGAQTSSIDRLLVSIPLVGTRTSVLQQVEALLRENGAHWTKRPAPAAYVVIKDKTQRGTVHEAIRTIHARALFSENLERSGQRAKYKQKPKKVEQFGDPRPLIEITSRHSTRARRWAENAARSRFLCQDEEPSENAWPKPDFVRLKERLETYARISEEALAAIPGAGANQRTPICGSE